MFGLMVMVLAGVLISWVRFRLGLAGRDIRHSGRAAGGDGLHRGAPGEGASFPIMMTAGTQAPTAEPVKVRSSSDAERLKPDAPDPKPQSERPGEPVPAAAVAAAAAAPEALGSGFVAVVGKTKVEVFGVPKLTAAGKAVAFGRAEARDLFALLSVSRDGVSAEGIVEALWPGDGERGGRRLESAVREINQAMRHATGCATGVRFVLKSGERRLLPAASFDVDFWRFGEACQRASTARENVARETALHEALTLYRGPLLAGRDDLWVLPVRQAVQRQAVDAAERLAELARPDDPGLAVDVLRHAVDRIDPLAEVLWCQLMTIQAELGRLPAVRRSFALLTERLAEIDALPSVQARQVYERLLR
ncbi:AfsR/SARP family transcriptional regulator [Nonomuraea soli]|uniref:DNA-binding SARP family transcriptional activator n=1 Tax=Nonomuraea soli TaxID=1032476 RepID=A0A7W0CUN8_9ACTN|nr:bacterial transcriptional activator domain-containing protein [Nonomuraea soli]MBA2897676.1 DNA-binding SARP family transcriptional activator [Nonomuraea soli]